MRSELVDYIRNTLESYNIDPIIFFGVVAILIIVSYYNEFRNWENIEEKRRSWIRTIIAGCVVLVLVLIIRLLNMLGVLSIEQ